MREYILTERERSLLFKFLEAGVKEEGFKMLLHRMRKNVVRLKEDLELVQKVLEKLS